MTMNPTIEVEFLKPFKELFNPYWRYIVLYGGRNSGKSYQVAEALILRSRREQLRILCTREIQKTIKDSVHKLLKDIIEKYGFDEFYITKDSIKNLATGSEFIFKGLRSNINEIKSTEGIDICWVEEAQGVTNESLDILTPTIRKEGSQIIFTFNRFTELDPVFVKFVLHKPDRTYVKMVNFDVLERHGLLTKEIQLEIEHDKKNYPALYTHKWLGEPLSQNEFAIIGRDDILKAMNQEVELTGLKEVGVDVARFGGDRSVFWMRQGRKTLKWETHEKKRTTETCDLLEDFLGFDTRILLKIDDGGVGGGVVDEMIKRGYHVIAINFGGEPKDKDKYPNLISEMWFSFASLVTDLELPLNQDLLMELSTRQWSMDRFERRCIESKDQYKKRGYRSPDLADACILAYFQRDMSLPKSPETEPDQGGKVLPSLMSRKF